MVTEEEGKGKGERKREWKEAEMKEEEDSKASQYSTDFLVFYDPSTLVKFDPFSFFLSEPIMLKSDISYKVSYFKCFLPGL